MNRYLFALAGLLALPAAGQTAAPAQVAAIATACEAFIRQQMKDPEAAKVRPDTLAVQVRGQWYMVLSVNGKNSFGAFTGFREWGCWLDGQLRVQRVTAPS